MIPCRAASQVIARIPGQQVRHSSGPLWGQNGFDNFRHNFLHHTEAAGSWFLFSLGGRVIEASGFWYKVSLFGVIPAVLLASINGYIGHQKEHNESRPEFVPYQHMRIRTKVCSIFFTIYVFLAVTFDEYPWGGMKSLFHNPHLNALPDGYEEDEHHH